MSDPWDDEGFGGEDDWVGGQSVEADLEDDASSGLDVAVDEAELDDAELDTEDDEEL